MLDPTFEFVPADPMPPAIAVLRNTAEPVWIFAYGSLMWDEDFPRAETETALLRGYHRRDARAVAEEAGRGNEAAVRIKSEAAQATRALMRVRERRIRLRGVGPLRAREMRRYLVLAAQTLLTRVDRIKEPPQDRLLAWAEQMLRRKMHNVAVVAVAAKLARIASAVTASNQPYQPSPVGSQPV